MNPRLSKLVAAFAVVFAALSAGVTHAAYVRDLIVYDGVYQNEVKFANFAGVYRPNQGWVSVGFDEMIANDILVGVLKAYTVNGVADSAYTGELTGLFALQVKTKAGYYEFGVPSEYPGGLGTYLQSGEVLVLMTEGLKDFGLGKDFNSLGNRPNDIAAAGDGTLFAAFGMPKSDDFAVAIFSGASLNLRLGVHELRLGPGVGPFPGVTAKPWPGFEREVSAYFAIDFPNPTPGTKGDWLWTSADSAIFRVTPEPGTVTALLAMGGAAGLGLALRRRKES